MVGWSVVVGWNVFGGCMSAVLEGLDWKALIQGKLPFKSEINDIALI